MDKRRDKRRMVDKKSNKMTDKRRDKTRMVVKKRGK